MGVHHAATDSTMSFPTASLPKMMLGFVVRRCVVALGHQPTAAEFADWANSGNVRLFGRPITEADAGVILRHRARLVTAKSATSDEHYVEVDELAAAPNLVRLANLRGRRASR